MMAPPIDRPCIRSPQAQEAEEITASKPVHTFEYQRKQLMVPQTVTQSRVVYETRMIPIQVRAAQNGPHLRARLPAVEAGGADRRRQEMDFGGA
jgi:hypothetical protein